MTISTTADLREYAANAVRLRVDMERKSLHAAAAKMARTLHAGYELAGAKREGLEGFYPDPAIIADLAEGIGTIARNIIVLEEFERLWK